MVAGPTGLASRRKSGNGERREGDEASPRRDRVQAGDARLDASGANPRLSAGQHFTKWQSDGQTVNPGVSRALDGELGCLGGATARTEVCETDPQRWGQRKVAELTPASQTRGSRKRYVTTTFLWSPAIAV